MSLGNMCMESLASGNTRQAVTYCAESLRLNSSNVKALTNLGAALIEEYRFDEAVPFLKRAVTIRPDTAKAHYNLGVALSHTGEYKAAVHHFQEALNIQPDFEKARLHLERVKKSM